MALTDEYLTEAFDLGLKVQIKRITSVAPPRYLVVLADRHFGEDQSVHGALRKALQGYHQYRDARARSEAMKNTGTQLSFGDIRHADIRPRGSKHR